MIASTDAPTTALQGVLPARPKPNNSYSPATVAVHADDRLNRTTDVAPALHVSTTFRYPEDPSLLVPMADEDAEDLSNPTMVYSRVAAPNTTRLETILSDLTNGHAITYSSGLSAFFALLTLLRPKVVAISGGYHGCHGVIDLHTKLYGLQKVDLYNEQEWDAAGLGQGDIVHIETPLNPTGEAINIQLFKEKAQKRGAYLTVDATFGPPGLQDPFQFGADIIMHSGTKYFGGHSDMLCGVLSTQRKEWWEQLWKERIYLGSVMGSLEGWLGIRSVRTLELRIQAQSSNAEKLVRWLDSALRAQDGDSSEGDIVRKTISRVVHASLQVDDFPWLKKQMPNGYGPVFAIYAHSREFARALPSTLHLFHHATSLGGVESLIEWRKMSDAGVDDRLLRISVGIEAFEDLKADLLQGLRQLVEKPPASERVQEVADAHLQTGLPT